MKNLGGYKREDSKRGDESTLRVSRHSKNPEASSRYKIGRSFGGDIQKERSERLERIEARRRHDRRRAIIFSLIGLALVAGILFLLNWLNQQRKFREENQEPVIEQLEPTVDIVDESTGGNISERVKNFVVNIEGDVKDYELEIDHVVLPLQKAHTIYVYLKDRDEYYKLTLDRETGVQAEDIARMVKYLDSEEIECDYVDLRVEGKAYYK